MSHSRYAGVVPAAGASLRMGRAKALLHIDGVSFLTRAVRALRSACDPVFVVVAEGDEESRAEAEQAGGRVILNPDPGEGPITSLRLVLEELESDVAGLVYLPVDHPLVRPETVLALVEAARAAEATLALPVHEGERGHPAVFGARLFVELADPTLEGGARTVTHRHLDDALLVTVDDVGVLVDIDTPEAYEEAVGGRMHPGDARR